MSSLGPSPLRIFEEGLRSVPAKSWAEMIRKVYEVDPMLCPQCGGAMKVIAFLTDYSAVDRIINHLKLTFVAERLPPPHIAYQKFLMAAEASAEYFLIFSSSPAGEVPMIFGAFERLRSFLTCHR